MSVVDESGQSTQKLFPISSLYVPALHSSHEPDKRYLPLSQTQSSIESEPSGEFLPAGQLVQLTPVVPELYVPSSHLVKELPSDAITYPGGAWHMFAHDVGLLAVDTAHVWQELLPTLFGGDVYPVGQLRQMLPVTGSHPSLY